MKPKTAEIESLVKSWPDTLSAALLYGQDEGLIRERRDLIVKQIVDDPKDPFRVALLSLAALREDPARLADEAQAISMIGGRRVVILEEANDSLTSSLDLLFQEDKAPEALILAIAGALPPRSSLRKWFEKSKHAVSLPAYGDNAQALDRLMEEVLREEGLRLSPDARSWLSENLGGDRMISRAELQKLALYKSNDKSTSISLEDARNCIGDSHTGTLDAIAIACFDGDYARLEKALDKAFQQGDHAISILRSLSRRAERLHFVAGQVEGGAALEAALRRLRPPLFFTDSTPFRNQLRRWPQARLAKALVLLMETERASKTAGADAKTLTARTCLKLAAGARR